MHVSRRHFLQGGLALATGGMLAGCGALQPRGQQPARIPKIGVLVGSDPGDTARIEPFKRGLVELGYIDG